jgi:plasmid stabilization system protein ParE
MPESGQRLPARPAVRVVPLVRYPFKLFYAVADETVTILHIRHAARRPWGE